MPTKHTSSTLQSSLLQHSLHADPQSWVPVAHWQMPLTQTEPGLHWVAQPPQLPGSELVTDSQPSFGLASQSPNP
jgi:hypothetical protein